MSKARNTLIAAATVGLLAASTAGVVAQEDAGASEDTTAPVEFTARWARGSSIRSGTTDRGDGVSQNRGWAWRPSEVTAASDPRLAGTLSIATNSDDYGVADGPVVYNYAFRIENDDGAWQQMPVISIASPGEGPADTVAVLVGEDGYEGLIAVMTNESDGGVWDLHGYILDGGVPSPPEPVIGE